MRTALLATAVVFATAGTASAQNYVNGYFRSDGTYVQPHYRSAPDGNGFNNFSTQGNVNPYTGQPGTQNPYYQPPQQQQPGYLHGNTYGYGGQRRY